MGRRINNKDLFEVEQIFQPQIDSAKGFITVLREIKEDIKRLATVSKNKVQAIDPADVEMLKKLGDEIKKADKLQKEFNKTTKNEERLRRQIRELEDDQVKAKQRFLKANADQRKAIKQQIQIEQALGVEITNNTEALENLEKIEEQEIRTKNEAIAANKALRAIIGDLRADVEEEADAIRRINAVIDDNTAFIKDNSDERSRNSQNVGNYTESIIDAFDALQEERNQLKLVVASLQEQAKQTNLTAEQQGLLNERLKEAQRQLKQTDDRIKQLGENSSRTLRAIGRLRRGFRLLGAAIAATGIGLLLNLVGKLGGALTQTREGAQRMQQVIARITAFIQVAASSLVQLFSGLFELLGGFATNVNNTFKRIGVRVELTMARLSGVFSDNSERIAELNKELSDIDSNSADLGTAIDKVASSFDNFGKRLEETVEQSDVLLDTTLKFTIQIEKLERQLAGLTAQQEKANAVADDATLTFQERIEANERLAELNTRVAREEREIAERNLKLAEQRLRVTLSSNEEVRKEIEAGRVNIQTTRGLIGVLEDEVLARKVSDEASREFTDAYIARTQARAEAANAEFEADKQRRELDQDLAEQRLDILIDGADNQKTVNERIIADENQTFERRRRLQEDTEKFIEESFRRQIEVLQDFTDEQIDADALVAESDAEVLQQRLTSIGLSEILTNRLLEVIRERRTATQDLIESENDLIESEREGADIRADIILQEQTLAKLRTATAAESEAIFAEFEQQRINNQIKALENQIEQETEGSAERLKLQQELNDLLISENQKRLDAEREANEKALQAEKDAQKERIEAAQAAAQAIADISSKQNERRQKELDEEAEASENQQKRLQEIADRGNIEAERSIAAELKRQAEIEREQQALLRRQQVQEFALSAFKTYGAKVDAGEENALGSTITDLSVLSAFVASLPTFYEGTATTVAEALGAPHMAGRDGYIIRADGSEKILNPEISAMTGDATTEEIGQVMKMYNQGVLKRVEPSVFVTTDNSDLAAQMGELKKELVAIKRKQAPEFNYDALSDVIITSLKKGNTLERRMEKNRRYF